ncbi:hypothetical protein K523DRAFT_324346 [Schizophyllum commune Tattone D]|nr:hypothetical protein K523DRAFT_324346 [Schizophyllum commune Tattone D]
MGVLISAVYAQSPYGGVSSKRARSSPVQLSGHFAASASVYPSLRQSMLPRKAALAQLRRTCL